jgi:hypothetical protein
MRVFHAAAFSRSWYPWKTAGARGALKPQTWAGKGWSACPYTWPTGSARTRSFVRSVVGHGASPARVSTRCGCHPRAARRGGWVRVGTDRRRSLGTLGVVTARTRREAMRTMAADDARPRGRDKFSVTQEFLA